jgi:hypothetical protein
MSMTLRLIPLAALTLAGCSADSFPFGRGAPPVTATEARADTPRPEARPAALRPPGRRPNGRPVRYHHRGRTRRCGSAGRGKPATGHDHRLARQSGRGGLLAEDAARYVTAPGRVVLEGASVNVELIPSGAAAGSGSQLSLAAFRVLGVPLTSLPEVTVFAR